MLFYHSNTGVLSHLNIYTPWYICALSTYFQRQPVQFCMHIIAVSMMLGSASFAVYYIWVCIIYIQVNMLVLIVNIYHTITGDAILILLLHCHTIHSLYSRGIFWNLPISTKRRKADLRWESTDLCCLFITMSTYYSV